MPLTLVVPGLLDLPATALAAVDARAPSLSRLVASSARAASEPDGSIAAACRACGLEKQDDWPLAPPLARAMGIDPGSAYWLRADPATLAVGANDVRLSALVDDLAPAHAQALVATLNAHFATDGIAFIAAPPACWFVRAQQVQRIATRPPEAALGAPLFAFLPSGLDAARWRRWQNELQMLLFEHPVNLERQRAGAAPVNSVWLWGGGTEKPGRPATQSILAREPLVVDLARGSAVEVRPPPPGFDALASPDATVWLDRVEADDSDRQLEMMDRAWMAPVERASDAGRLSGLEVVLGGRAHALRFLPRRPSLAQRLLARFSPPRGSRMLAGAAPAAER